MHCEVIQRGINLHELLALTRSSAVFEFPSRLRKLNIAFRRNISINILKYHRINFHPGARSVALQKHFTENFPKNASTKAKL